MADDKNISTYFEGGGVTRSPGEIVNDPDLSKERKIELLKRYKEGGEVTDRAVLRDADLELDKLLKLNSLANER